MLKKIYQYILIFYSFSSSFQVLVEKMGPPEGSNNGSTSDLGDALRMFLVEDHS